MLQEKNKDYRYEYATTPLTGMESKYIFVPASVIFDVEIDTKRIAVFSYLKIKCGLDDEVLLSVPDMVEWCGNKPDRRINGANDKFLNIVNYLSEIGYMTHLTEPSRSRNIKCKLNVDYIKQECKEGGFSVLYLDEIKKIMNYKKENSKDGFLTNATILLVFAYLRYKINRRPNELMIEHRSQEGIDDRRRTFPEAYDSHLKDIADDIGISSRTLSKIVDVLEYDLELIKTDRMYRVKLKDDKFKTLPIIFTNAYKREGTSMLNVEKDYSYIESENKAKLLNKMYGGYKINKDKRKDKVIE